MKERRLPEKTATLPTETWARSMEEALPVMEEATFTEEALPAMEKATLTGETATGATDEFRGRSGNARDEGTNRHAVIKKIMLMPVVTTVATLSIVLASQGVDPLGDDFLNQDHLEIQEDTEDGEEGEKSLAQTKDALTEENGEAAEKLPDETDEDGSGEETWGEVREYPGELGSAYIHVHYVPDDTYVIMESLGEMGLEEARKWVGEQGGDPASLTYVGQQVQTRKESTGVFVGDEDDLDNAYDPFGNIRTVNELHVYYDAYKSLRDVP